MLHFEEVDRTQVAVVGGKGAHLGELCRIDGIRVPPGFCVTTDAFRRFLAGAGGIDVLLEQVARLTAGELEPIRAISAELRQRLQETSIPDEVSRAITAALARLGDPGSFAVRSSATAEDLPGASFAGQQDTYLNVVGRAAILEHVRRCWASLFTDRAVTYRLRNGFDHRKVHMAVVVQEMVFPDAAGVLFTADPVTGNRKVASVEAVFGLGESLVSGAVNADVYKVRDGAVVARTIAPKSFATRGSRAGGTEQQPIEPQRQQQPVLTDAQVVRLADWGRRIEAHFGTPQDIEWCLSGEDLQIVQSRPITTLFPIPAETDGANHVYISVGHQQMMTDPMKPLGLSMWQLTTPAPMREAGGRLFVDVTRALGSPASRAGLIKMAARSDPLIGEALEAIVARGDFVPVLPDPPAGASPAPGTAASPPLEADPAIVRELIRRAEASVDALKREIRTKSGPELFDFILADLQELKRIIFHPQGYPVVLGGMEAAWWLNDQLQAWLGEKNVADALAQSVANNVTSEMGLALLDVADVIRPHPRVVAYLERVEDEHFLDELPNLEGGHEARDAIQAWLDKYGMRCVGEIDLTRPRWSERPGALLPMLLGNVKNAEAGAAKRRFEEGLRTAASKEREVLERLRALPDGARKAEQTKRMIDRLRTFSGYREYPKYTMVSRYFVYKQALLEEAQRLVHAGVLREKEDCFFLRFQELHEVVRTRQVDQALLRERKAAFAAARALTPPRVLTSEGEGVSGAYRRDDHPPGALVGLAVSSGTVEGRARVIFDTEEANLEAGDILVTPYTDPSWTPLFVTIRGVVTEVGGLMTHGAVIAREYGLPAVVGVEHATRRIRDGQRIRVNGTDGYVELLP